MPSTLGARTRRTRSSVRFATVASSRTPAACTIAAMGPAFVAYGVQGGRQAVAVGDVGAGEVNRDPAFLQAADPVLGVRGGGAAAHQGEAAGAAPHEPLGDDVAEAAETAGDQVDAVGGDDGCAVGVGAGAGQAGYEAARLAQGDEAFVVGVAQLGPQGVGAAGRRQVDEGDRQFGVLLGDGEAEAPGERLLRVRDLAAVAAWARLPRAMTKRRGDRPRGRSARARTRWRVLRQHSRAASSAVAPSVTAGASSALSCTTRAGRVSG